VLHEDGAYTRELNAIVLPNFSEEYRASMRGKREETFCEFMEMA
jgi:hypothetical protein